MPADLRQVDWGAVRAEFPALCEWTYLNTATLGLISKRSTAAIQAHFERRDRFANADFLSWWDDMDGIRALIAQMLACQSTDIAFFPNSSAALALAVTAIGWQPGDEIVTLLDEFPNQVYLSACPGVRLVETSPDRLWDSLTPRTRMVAISAVNYQTGLRAPWEQMAAPLRERGIFFYVDATQAFGALQTRLTSGAPDMLSVNCYKWACSPPGAAFAFIHPDLRRTLPPNIVGWRSDAGWRDMQNLKHGVPEFSNKAEKYESGMLAFPSLYGLEAALELILEIGPAAIEERVLALAKACGGDGSSQIVTILLADAPEVAAQLKREGILVSARRGKLRISPHFYNNEDDIARLQSRLAGLTPPAET
jgi:selenocysteine lyase/cysteine desulfurase